MKALIIIDLFCIHEGVKCTPIGVPCHLSVWKEKFKYDLFTVYLLWLIPRCMCWYWWTCDAYGAKLELLLRSGIKSVSGMAQAAGWHFHVLQEMTSKGVLEGRAERGNLWAHNWAALFNSLLPEPMPTFHLRSELGIIITITLHMNKSNRNIFFGGVQAKVI